MGSAVTRLFSDLHYGDRASRLRSLDQLLPLVEGASRLILNGDTLDTRPSGDASADAALHATVTDFFAQRTPPTVFHPGNHDPHLSTTQFSVLGDGRFVATHGDLLFDDIVPWSQDASLAARLVQEERALRPAALAGDLAALYAAHRAAASRIPQRHHSERNPFKYTVGFLADTVWPPTRVVRILRAWRETPARADAFLQRHFPAARFFAMGHTHRLGLTRTPRGVTVFNTGSLCLPGDAAVIDLTDELIRFRRIDVRGRAFRLGETLAEFALADT